MNSDGVDRTIVGWRAWYTGGRVFESANPKDWADLPAEGMLLAVQYTRDGRGHIRTNQRLGQTVYWLKWCHDGDWVICCDSRADAKLDGIPAVAIKEGEWTSIEEMNWARSNADRLRGDPPK